MAEHTRKIYPENFYGFIEDSDKNIEEITAALNEPALDYFKKGETAAETIITLIHGNAVFYPPGKSEAGLPDNLKAEFKNTDIDKFFIAKFKSPDSGKETICFITPTQYLYGIYLKNLLQSGIITVDYLR